MLHKFEFLKSPQARAGAFLLLAVITALMIENSPLSWLYEKILHMPVEIKIGQLEIAKNLILWINDGLMSVFFLLIGLEVKREIITGELSSIRKVALPAIAAIGGMIVPALIYIAINYNNQQTLGGWAIPAATDIAFALGVLAILGSRIPPALKVLLLSLAIIDDIGAIVIIAVFYTADISHIALMLAGAGLVGAFILNRAGVIKTAPYILIGVFIWVCVLKSGVHATLAGVLLAMTIPINSSPTARDGKGALHRMEHSLHPWVTWLIMPLFAFANAGVSLQGVSLPYLLSPLPLGIIAGLLLGKQIGIPLFVAIGVKTGLCEMPRGISWRHIWGMSLLCGIGFTMSLFIGTLAFGDDLILGSQVRIATLIASVIAGISGYLVLRSDKGL